MMEVGWPATLSIRGGWGSWEAPNLDDGRLPPAHPDVTELSVRLRCRGCALETEIALGPRERSIGTFGPTTPPIDPPPWAEFTPRRRSTRCRKTQPM
jgi:hypothetical protein